MERGLKLRRALLASGLLIPLAGAFGTARAAEMVLVEKGISKAPIIVAAGAPPETARAANDLAEYIEKISGARPKVVTGAPEPTPGNAIWVGIQPKATALFPGVTFDFQNPEEILIACNGRHLVIAGRDRMAGDKQIEYGTANAVFTFIQKQLDVRWLWPGSLGEDIVRRDTVALAPFEFRFHPLFRQREVFQDWRALPGDWARFQRVSLDSLRVSPDHAFKTWWDKYHVEHPDYFALQTDGTRSGYPGPNYAKICESNPRVWAQWLDNAEVALRENPALVLNAAENDDSNSGWCVCENCRAWDPPKGPMVSLTWKGKQEEHVALTDRSITFLNALARGLKERFPGREIYVSGFAYGPTEPASMVAVPDKNVIIGFVGHFPTSSPEWRQQDKDLWKQWAEKAPLLVYRPNLFYYSGGMNGFPSVATRNTLEDFRFLAENHCVGITIDTTPGHWATQGPQYYLMAQLAWDPLQDGRALLDDYYRRGFGDAAGAVEKYFDLMEEAHGSVMERPGWRPSMGLRYKVLGNCLEIYTDELLNKADGFLREAEAKTAGGPEAYRKRVAFIRTGLDFTKLQLKIARVMTQVRESKGKDAAAVRKATELCYAREELLRREENRFAVDRRWLMECWIRNRQMEDYLGPPSAAFREEAGVR